MLERGGRAQLGRGEGVLAHPHRRRHHQVNPHSCRVGPQHALQILIGSILPSLVLRIPIAIQVIFLLQTYPPSPALRERGGRAQLGRGEGVLARPHRMWHHQVISPLQRVALMHVYPSNNLFITIPIINTPTTRATIRCRRRLPHPHSSSSVWAFVWPLAAVLPACSWP